MNAASAPILRRSISMRLALRGEGYLMLQIKVPGRIINSEQLETIGWLSCVYAHSTGDITTQGIQIHHVRVEVLPHIIAELNKVGLTSVEASEDLVRNQVPAIRRRISGEQMTAVAGLARRYA